MDSLQEILGSKSFKPPDEVQAIKDYVKRKYASNCSVRLEKDAYIVSAPNSALAAMLQLEQRQLIEACGLKKKLVIRTGR
jgi:hypothetical protein